MASAPPLPCPRCGYDAPVAPCPHCSGPDTAAEFARTPASGPGSVALAALALPRGLGILLSTSGIKRWLVPPLVLTVGAFVAAFTWLWGLVADALERSIPPEVDIELWGIGWAAAAIEWFVTQGWALLAAKTTGFLAFLLVGSLVWWYCFSLLFEAVAGPFLDEVHGRLETRWYGLDPRSTIERPVGLDSGAVTRFTLLATAVGLVLAWVTWRALDGPWALLALVALAAPFAGLAALRADYGRWLGWFARVEGGAARSSLAASVLTLTLLVLALPLYLVPVVGWWLVGAIAGFATALGLLDVPFSRRGWYLRQRLAFVRAQALPLTVYGAVAGLVFSIPFVGPVLMVPAASVAGLWLFARLDKRSAREWGERRRAAAG